MKNLIKVSHVVLLVEFVLFAAVINGQTTAFSYQGRLTDAGNPANGSFQMQFKLFDALAAGTQIGSTITDVPVSATQGVFSVRLDFGSSALSGANRWLEIAVRHNSGEVYATVSPREQLASSPYAVRTLSAASADLALDSNKLGGLPASDYVTNSAVGGSFIRNQATPQANSDFNISGNGTVGGSLTVGPNGLFLTNGTASFKAGVAGNFVTLGTTTNTPLSISTNGGTNNGSLTLDTSGNIGINTIFPNHKLTIDTLGGPTWTTQAWGGALALRNSSAIGWQLNSAGQSFGIGQSSDGLSFFHTNAGPGTTLQPPFYEMQITNAGNVGIGTTAPNAKLFVQGEYNGVGIAATGNASQSRDKGGWVKAMVFVLANGTIARCYNGLTGVSTGNCGFTVTANNTGYYAVDFGFQVSDRFASATSSTSFVNDFISARISRFGVANNNEIDVYTFHTDSGGFVVSDFYLIVY